MPSRHLSEMGLREARQTLRDQGIDPARVSLACVVGNHDRCKRAGGKVLLRETENGNRYARCECPRCNHSAAKIRRVVGVEADPEPGGEPWSDGDPFPEDEGESEGDTAGG